jgi:hypothetical protein
MSVLEKELQEIQSFLDKFADDSIHDELKKKISNNSVAAISKEDILKKIFSDVKLSKTAKKLLKSPTTKNIVSLFSSNSYSNTKQFSLFEENKNMDDAPQNQNNSTENLFSVRGNFDIVMGQEVTSNIGLSSKPVRKTPTPFDENVMPHIGDKNIEESPQNQNNESENPTRSNNFNVVMGLEPISNNGTPSKPVRKTANQAYGSHVENIYLDEAPQSQNKETFIQQLNDREELPVNEMFLFKEENSKILLNYFR